MKILALDLSFSEDVSALPKKYGGWGRTVYAIAKNIPDFWVAGSFESLRNCDLQNKIILSEEEVNKIRLENSLDGWDNQFDLIFHSKSNTFLNTTKPQLVWSVGQFEQIHPKIEHLLLHNKQNQNPVINNQDTKIYEFILGVDIPEFQQYDKEDFLFSCSNHYPAIQTNFLIDLCNYFGIKAYFAGPIDDNYRSQLKFDNKNTIYLGVISEEKKINYLKKAKVFCSLYGFPINECPLSFKQALSYGCLIICTKIGDLPNKIKHSYNGFLINSVDDFMVAWQNKDKIRQIDCYNSVMGLSTQKMVESFNSIINNFSK